jgi:hypothetical protein
MTPPLLKTVSQAFEEAWSRETCDPVDLDDWSPANPSRGQCGSTALVLHDIFGGELLIAEVHHLDGTLQGYHYWNRLPDGEEVDLTRMQFTDDEVVETPRTLIRPTGQPRRCVEQYILLRDRVLEALQLGGARSSCVRVAVADRC